VADAPDKPQRSVLRTLGASPHPYLWLMRLACGAHHYRMTRMLPEFIDPDPADRSTGGDLLARQEPEEEDDEDEDEDREEDDNDGNSDGYSE